MTIRELDDSITIQGAYRILGWDDTGEKYKVLADGEDFESDWYLIRKYADMTITYMYASGKKLHIEVVNQ